MLTGAASLCWSPPRGATVPRIKRGLLDHAGPWVGGRLLPTRVRRVHRSGQGISRIPEPMIEELAGSCHTALERHRRVGGSFCCTSRETLAIVGPYQFRARRAGTPSFVSVDVSRALAFDP